MAAKSGNALRCGRQEGGARDIGAAHPGGYQSTAEVAELTFQDFVEQYGWHI
jgi:hypothetical protein